MRRVPSVFPTESVLRLLTCRCHLSRPLELEERRWEHKIGRLFGFSVSRGCKPRAWRLFCSRCGIVRHLEVALVELSERTGGHIGVLEGVHVVGNFDHNALGFLFALVLLLLLLLLKLVLHLSSRRWSSGSSCESLLAIRGVEVEDEG